MSQEVRDRKAGLLIACPSSFRIAQKLEAGRGEMLATHSATQNGECVARRSTSYTPVSCGSNTQLHRLRRHRLSREHGRPGEGLEEPSLHFSTARWFSRQVGYRAGSTAEGSHNHPKSVGSSRRKTTRPSHCPECQHNDGDTVDQDDDNDDDHHHAGMSKNQTTIKRRAVILTDLVEDNDYDGWCLL